MALQTNLQKLKEKCHLWDSTVKDIREQFGEGDFEFTDLIPVVGLYQTLYLCKSEPSYQTIWGKYASWCVQRMANTENLSAIAIAQRVSDNPEKAGYYLDHVAYWSMACQLDPDSKNWKETLISLFLEYENEFINTLSQTQTTGNCPA